MNGRRDVIRTLRILAVALSAWSPTASAFGQTTAVQDFNGGWRLHVGDAPGAEAAAFDDRAWPAVTLPRAFNEDEAFRVDIGKLSTGVAWYRKAFDLPADAADKKVLLEFEGVRHAGRVFVNGRPLALSENGVMAFGADLSGVVRTGRNVVAVRSDSAWNYKEQATGSPFQWNDRNFYANYGGINKNVRLHVKDKLYQTLPLHSSLGTTGVYAYARDFDVGGRAATIVAESQVRNEHAGPKRVAYAATVLDADGKPVARFDAPPVEVAAGQTVTLSASGRVGNLNFWSWGYGYLYTVRTELLVDGHVVDRVDTRTGFRKTEFAAGAVKLNERTLHLKGYAQRTTNEWPALGTDVPAWVSDFSNGLMVRSNANLVRWMHVTPSKQDVESCDRVGLLQALPAGDSERDPDGRRWELRVELMRDAIVYNRNNPSVVFYEAGNKGISEPHMNEMLALKNQFDPHGGRAMGCREMLAIAAAEWGGEMLYVNKSAGKPMWATEYMRDESPRAWADAQTPPFHQDGDGPDHKGQSAAAYNRNGDSMAAETVARWFDYWRERPGTGRRVNAGGVNIIFSDSNTHHRGTLNYRTSGEVDAVRLPKDGFFAHKVMWDGWVDVEKPAAHLVGHWNYPAGTTRTVQVVSSADKVELRVNGKIFGYGTQTNRFLFTFDRVAYAPGTLAAVGYDANGDRVCDAELRTSGEPAAVRLTPHTGPGGFVADGSDLALIDVEVVDADGRRCPTAFDTIDFALDGPAEWRGGIAIGPDNFILSKSLPVQLGVNRVVVRSATTPGTVRLSAKSGTLTPATIELHTAAPAATPAAPPPSMLSRGPTPAGDSVRPTRTPLEIARVTAGSATDKAAATIDDNEATAWTSIGDKSAAWIKYDLTAPATVSEVTMKLSAWRTRGYAVDIRVDDHTVFRGETPRSLGYVTLPLKPTRGRTVTVRLTGGGKDGDAFDLTEVTGQKQTAGTTGGGRDTLGICEVEFYGPASTD